MAITDVLEQAFRPVNRPFGSLHPSFSIAHTSALFFPHFPLLWSFVPFSIAKYLQKLRANELSHNSSALVVQPTMLRDVDHSKKTGPRRPHSIHCADHAGPNFNLGRPDALLGAGGQMFGLFLEPVAHPHKGDPDRCKHYCKTFTNHHKHNQHHRHD